MNMYIQYVHVSATVSSTAITVAYFSTTVALHGHLPTGLNSAEGTVGVQKLSDAEPCKHMYNSLESHTVGTLQCSVWQLCNILWVWH